MSSIPSSWRRNSDWIADQSAGSMAAMDWASSNMDRGSLSPEGMDDRSVGAHAEEREAERGEPRLARGGALQHRDGRSAPGHGAGCRVHRDRPESARRMAGARIEDVAMAHAVDLDEALVITARRDSAGRHGQPRDNPAFVTRIADADLPRHAPGLLAEDREVARQIRERAFDPMLAQHRRGPIDGVLLAEPAEVELHPFARQANAPCIPFQTIPADERQQRRKCFVGRHERRIEAPCTPQHARGRIESAIALAIARIGEVEEMYRFLIDLDGGLPRLSIDSRHHTVRSVS